MSAGPVNAPSFQLDVSAVSSFGPVGVTHVQSADGTVWTLANSNTPITFPLNLPVGARITGYTHYLSKASSGAHTHQGQIFKRDGSTSPAQTALGSGSSNNQNAPGATQLTETSLALDVADGFQYYYKFTPDATSSGDLVMHLSVFYTFPNPV